MLPETPITITYALVMAVVCAFAVYRRNGCTAIALVMVLNWLGTRAVTGLELSGTAQAIIDVSSAAVLMLMWQKCHMVVLPVSALFALMVFMSGAYQVGMIARETMWAWADVAAYLQLLLIVGASAASGGGGIRLALGAHLRSRIRGVWRAVAARIPLPPHS